MVRGGIFRLGNLLRIIFGVSLMLIRIFSDVSIVFRIFVIVFVSKFIMLYIRYEF